MYGMPKPYRSDPPSLAVDLRDGLGVVEVWAHADWASLLLLGGRPAVLEGADCAGSICRLAARAGAGAPRPAALQDLRDWLASPGIAVDPLTGHAPPPDPEQLRPLLRLFASGRYRLRASAWWCQETDGCGQAGSWCHPDVPMLVTTESWPPLDQTMIAEYRRGISGGDRPAAVAVRPHPENEYTLYLLDGHHKVAAYRAERVPPLLIEIIPTRPRPLPREEFLAQLGNPGPFARLLDLGSWPAEDAAGH